MSSTFHLYGHVLGFVEDIGSSLAVAALLCNLLYFCQSSALFNMLM